MTDAYGGVMEIENSGREICIDAPINPSLEYYRFNWRAVLQWVYTPPSSFGSSPPPIYGWRSIFSGGLFNIAGPKQFSTSIKLKNHPIITLSYKPLYLLDSLSRIPHGWILMIDQYGTTKESYDFHERMNKQFSADGSLFDPILTQVYGNIHCKTDTKKIVLGFFDLNSYRHYRYFLNPGSNEYSKIVQRRINRRLNIPNEGTTVGNPPDFWEIYN